MARIRTIKPEFWTSEQIVECSPIARLLFIGMWNFCDDGGNHPASTKTLKMQIFPGDDIAISQIDALVAELVAAGLLSEYLAEGRRYWNVTGWKHQKIDRPSYKYPRPIADNSPNDRRQLDARHPPEGKGREGNGRDVSSSMPATDDEYFASLAEQEQKRQAEADARVKVEMTPDWIPDLKVLDDHLKFLGTKVLVNGRKVTSADLTDEITSDFRSAGHRKQERRTNHDWHGGLANYLIARIKNPKPNAPRNGLPGGQNSTGEPPRHRLAFTDEKDRPKYGTYALMKPEPVKIANDPNDPAWIARKAELWSYLK